MVSFYYPRNKHLFVCSQITNVEEYNCKAFNWTRVFLFCHNFVFHKKIGN